MKFLFFAGAIVVFPSLAFGQVMQQTPLSVAPATPASPLVVQTQTSGPVLRTGTIVVLKLAEELSTKDKKLRANQHFQMEVSDSVILNGIVIIPAGTPAVGEITEVRNKGMWGKSGRFGAQVLYLLVNGRQIRLTGTFDSKGTGGGAGAIAASAVIFAPAGFFISGTNASLPIGTPVKAFIGEDVPLALPAQAAIVPMQVPASAPLTVQSIPSVAPAAAAGPTKQ